MWKGFPLYKSKEIWSDLGLRETSLQSAMAALWRLYQIFERYDATLIEINPLAITPMVRQWQRRY